MCAAGKPRWKRSAALLLAVLLCTGLGGCLKHPVHHNRWEVLSYLKKTFPGEEVKISWQHSVEPDSQHEQRTDWVWDCYFADMPQVVFHVRSSWWTDSLLPVTGYSLYHDRDQVFWQYYLNQYLSGEGSLDAWEIEDYDLEMEFSSMEQVYPAAEQLRDFYSWFGAQPHAGRVHSARCSLTGLPLPTWLLDDWIYISRSTGEDNVYDMMVGSCAEMLKGYYAFYGLSCPGYVPEKVRSYARSAWPWDEGYPYPDAIRCNGEALSRSTFAGVGIKACYVSYGGFYDMLSRLDFPVEGTPEHFSFTGLDGCLYEFSYEFYEEKDGEPQWYFTRDGKRQTSGSTSYTDGAPLLYLKDERLPDMTGLTVTYDR